MKLDQDEVQIVKGPEFWVTDKRVVFKSCEILMNTIAAPQLEERIVSASAQVGVMAIGGVMLAGGSSGSWAGSSARSRRWLTSNARASR
jgi:hypothetical protein